ncbi:PREDICTED: probable E3 ubiquitin-protein ligase MGRN1 [Priapulus caudatus]|uniref:RING-type E3 ubiquitin transferase n=1 Tax=Priapulus caudatus TaxID=37621 RepID=A0ABM1DUX6_PRICU|nr:PREDICTED: probable E3 ubiquitin-protein ligase MGRN1 [Priapulus caudatus]
MGALASRQNAGVEEVDITTHNAYRYPPKSGCYFGSHFIMGGERFDTTPPEAYLFGENADLNFLGNRPTPFPYPAPQANEPIKTLKSLVNIRKDSVRFVRSAETPKASGDETALNTEPNTRYNIEFTFDCDVRCAITIYYFATEELANGMVVYHPRDPAMNSETYHYKRGANQQFAQTSHVFDPSRHADDDLNYSPEREVLPVVVQCVTDETEDFSRQAHITFCYVERSSDGAFSLKPLKQKQMVDGLCYLLQEIYGIENKNADSGAKAGDEDDVDDNGSECVICMSEVRDTLILPCRHLCLCNCCADSLRYQANNCPICRSPFRALLQMRALRKKVAGVAPPPPPASEAEDSSGPAVHDAGVPPGYEAISLIEALNGPSQSSRQREPSLPAPRTEAGGVAAAPPSYRSPERARLGVPNGDVASQEPGRNLTLGLAAAAESGAAESPGGGGGDTPEVIMSGVARTPEKDASRAGKSTAKRDTKEEQEEEEESSECTVLFLPEEDRVEIVDEMQQPRHTRFAKRTVEDEEEEAEEEEEEEEGDVDGAASEVGSEEEEAVKDQEAKQTHTEDLESSKPPRQVPEKTSIPSGTAAVKDCIRLPGTPDVDRVSGESYGSSCSTNRLLEENQAANSGNKTTML